MKGKTALIAGASGLVGNELLHLLIEGEEYETVHALVRRPLDINHPKLIEVICNFDNLEEVEEYFQVDDVFVCLGTTIKKAKTKEAMYKVDVEYPVAIAQLANKKYAKQFLFISSMNANKDSSIWYSKMKGMLEEEVKKLPFVSISIFRPSLLIGERKEFRFGEKIAEKLFQGVSFLMPESWKSNFAIEASTVAQSMYEVAQTYKRGIAVYSSKDIRNMIKKPR